MGKDKNNRGLSVDEIYEKARKLAPEEVSEFLDDVCSKDSSIRRQVEAMLAAPDDFLDEPVAPEIAGKFEEAADDAAHGEKNSPAGIADRNLLYGIIALQMNFITRNALIKAMHDWVLKKTTPIEEIFYDNQAIGSETKLLLTALAEKHLEHHAGDARASLKTMSSTAGIREELSTIGDPDLDDSLTGMGTGDAETIPVTREPTRAGERFQILRFFDKGGMGKVSIAQDAELNREVAFKEIRDDCADIPEFQNRFKIEAEITGGLEHPGIVPVYGLGTLDDGRPFYAMRLIKGDNLKIAIRDYRNNREQATTSERNLELRRLLRRFIDVCEAVHYAHSRKVLHRDLKPGNIMLGRYGETLVLDWGLAKAVGNRNEHDPEATLPLVPQSGDSAAPTRGTIGTPSYMSPEQARNDEIGPATDVFSLGATLYYLLCGRAPYVVHEDDPEKRAQQTLRLARHCEFAEPHEIDKQVPLPLNAICLKAMRSDPKERYSTTQELADEVERWLADEPVSVYRDPFIDRFARTVRRHRATAAGTSAILATALIASVVIAFIVQQNHQREVKANAKLSAANKRLDDSNTQLKVARDRADADLEMVRKLSFDLIDQAEGSLAQIPGTEKTRQAITKIALRGFRDFFERRSDDNPEFMVDMARLHFYAANLDRFYGNFEDSENHFNRSLALINKVISSDESNRVVVLSSLSESLRDLSLMYLASGRLEESSLILEKARTTSQAIPSKTDESVIIATITLVQAELERELGNYKTAYELTIEAEKLFQVVVSNPNPDSGKQARNEALLTTSRVNQSSVLRDLGEVEKAVSMMGSVVTAAENGLTTAGSRASRHVRMVAAHAHLELARAIKAANENDSERIQAHLDRAIVELAKLSSEFPATTNYRQYLALSHALMAESKIKNVSDSDVAKHHYQEAINLTDAILEGNVVQPDVFVTCSRIYQVGAINTALSVSDSAIDFREKTIELLQLAQNLSKKSKRIEQLTNRAKSIFQESAN